MILDRWVVLGITVIWSIAWPLWLCHKKKKAKTPTNQQNQG